MSSRLGRYGLPTAASPDNRAERGSDGHAGHWTKLPMRRFLGDQELSESYRLMLIDEISILSLEYSRMKRLFSVLTVLTLILSFNVAQAADGPPVTPFEAEGVVADVLQLFPCAIKDNKKADRAGAQTTLKEVAARALVTKDGVYAFLETPENKRALKGVKPGTAVSIKGRLLAAGALLHIDSLSKPKGDPGVDLARYDEEEGKEVTLRGANKCQCGLNVADLPHSCSLGHLHHLEANDGKIYNYIQYGDGKAAFLGDGSHFKNVELKARVFPGQFLLVERGKLMP
jgi:hypothetical protein